MQILERETKKTMLCVIIALMPALIMAVYNFGARGVHTDFGMCGSKRTL